MNIKRDFSFYCFCVLLFASNFLVVTQTNAQASVSNRLQKVIIDPGHGGGDSGASGDSSFEKDITLAIAMKLKSLIELQIQDVQVYMTRTEDVYDDVHEKAEKANAEDIKGHTIFISIHCNDAPPKTRKEATGEYHFVTKKIKGKKVRYKVAEYRRVRVPSTAKGTETYIWGVDKNSDKASALRENMGVDSATLEQLNSVENQFEIQLRVKQYFERSNTLAINVEDEFTKVNRASRQVRQRGKGIWVLQAVAMPAILIETGFLSNPEEEAYLNSEEGQLEIAQCIVNALKRFRNPTDANNTTDPNTTNALSTKN